MDSELGLELCFGEWLCAELGSFGDWLDGNRLGNDACLLVFEPPVLLERVRWETLHSEDFDVVSISSGEGILEPEAREKAGEG